MDKQLRAFQEREDAMSKSNDVPSLKNFDWKLYNGDVNPKLFNHRNDLDWCVDMNYGSIKSRIIKSINQQLKDLKLSNHEKSDLQVLMDSIFTEYPTAYNSDIRFGFMVQIKLIQLQIKSSNNSYQRSVYDKAFEYACRQYIESLHFDFVDLALDNINVAINKAKKLYQKGNLVSE